MGLKIRLKQRKAAGNLTARSLRWNDFSRGDRVHHFDYGEGTIDGASPLWLHITWDNPDERLSVHTAEMARFLSRLARDR